MHSPWNPSVHREPARVPWQRSYTVNPCASSESCTLKPRPLCCHCNSPTGPTAKQSSTAQFRQRSLYLPICLNKDLKELQVFLQQVESHQALDHFTASHSHHTQDKTTLRAWQDHDRNSRQGRTRLHLKRDTRLPPSDHRLPQPPAPASLDATLAVQTTRPLRRVRFTAMLRHLRSYVRWVVIQALSLHAAISRP